MFFKTLLACYSRSICLTYSHNTLVWAAVAVAAVVVMHMTISKAATGTVMRKTTGASGPLLIIIITIARAVGIGGMNYVVLTGGTGSGTGTDVLNTSPWVRQLVHYVVLSVVHFLSSLLLYTYVKTIKQSNNQIINHQVGSARCAR